jgi:hypothetical protein
MDVSRVEAISPKQIDWRKLTAKEIIEYDDSGISVPVEYLQWAKNFLSDVSSADNDDTTYETAQQVQVVNTGTNIEGETSDVENQEVTDNENSEETQDSGELTPAQAKRQQLIDDGVSLYKQAKIFKKESKKTISENTSARFSMAKTGALSDNEIQAVDNYMKRILSKADAAQSELKSEISKVGNSSGDKVSFAKINKLQKELEKYGKDGQSKLANADGKFSSYDLSLQDKSSIIFRGLDVGSETVDIGIELLSNPTIISYSVARSALNKGEKAMANSDLSQAMQTEVLLKNSQNQNSVQRYSNEIENKTGIAGVENSNKDKSSDDNSTQKSQSETDKTETDKAASANLDSILKAKIRKGENLEA